MGERGERERLDRYLYSLWEETALGSSTTPIYEMVSFDQIYENDQTFDLGDLDLDFDSDNEVQDDLPLLQAKLTFESEDGYLDNDCSMTVLEASRESETRQVGFFTSITTSAYRVLAQSSTMS